MTAHAMLAWTRAYDSGSVALATHAATGDVSSHSMNNVGAALNTVGAEVNYVNNQINYNSNKIDALNTGLGSLVDADLAKDWRSCRRCRSASSWAHRPCRWRTRRRRRC